MSTNDTTYSDRAEFVVPWCGYRHLISLWDMKEYMASRLVSISESLAQAGLTAIGLNGPSKEDREHIQRHLARAEEELKFLGLEMTRISAERLRGKLDNEHEETAGEIDLVIQRLNDEVRSLKLIYLSPDKIQFLSKTDLFGDDFKSNFPAANAEVIEAGNCFAFDRFTACAFHLMRSLEIVLKALFLALGLPPIKSAGAQNWNGILREIRDYLDNNKTIPDYDFYDTAYAFLAAAKNPMRNATMHVDVAYDEPGAKRLLDAVGAFMHHAATKLKEQP